MSVKYVKIPSKNGPSFRYTKNGLMIKESKVPPELMEKFEYATELEYDDKPEKRRCIFDEAYQSRQRFLNSELVDLCEWHYQHARLGQIAQQIAENEKEAAKEAEKLAKLTPQEKAKRTRKINKKTALSAMVD